MSHTDSENLITCSIWLPFVFGCARCFALRPVSYLRSKVAGRDWNRFLKIAPHSESKIGAENCVWLLVDLSPRICSQFVVGRGAGPPPKKPLLRCNCPESLINQLHRIIRQDGADQAVYRSHRRSVRLSPCPWRNGRIGALASEHFCRSPLVSRTLLSLWFLDY